MRYHFGAAALALVSSASLTLAQDCPPGYEKSKLSWVDCPTSGNKELQCATIEVPLDWTTPNGNEKLKLRLVRQPAAANTPNAKSIIINPGGPGESGIKSVVDGGSGYQDIVGDGFHIIGFDPRGVGLTTPYMCPEAEGDAGVYNTDTGLATAFQYNTAQARDCANPKYRSDLIGTAFVARDIKAIAEAIGEDGLIRYWGYSYGTLLGATLSAMFPDKVDRVILDGNINPNDYYRGLGQEGSADTDRGVARFFEQCAEAGSSNCAVAVAGQNGRQLQGTFDTFLAKLSYDQAKSVRDAFYKVLYFAKATAYTDFAKVLSGYYSNPGSITKRSLGRRQLDWDPEYEEIKTELALSGITCSDVVQRPTGSASNFKQWLSIYQRTSKYGGDIAISILYQCSVWTVNAKEKFTGSFSGIRTKTPILFLNTQYDPVTPLISAQNSAMGFVGARVLVSSGVGHCTNANESPELNNAIKTYMVSGTFPTVNKVYAPEVTNVFRAVKKRTLNGPNLSRRDIDYPAMFKNKNVVVKRQTPAIPAGCTKIAVSSSALVSASSTPVAISSSAIVSSVPASSAASSTPIVSASSSAIVSLSSSVAASSTPIVLASSSAIVSASSSVASSSAPHSSSASVSISVSAILSSSSAAQSSSGAHISDSASASSIAQSSVASGASSVSVSVPHQGGASTTPVSTASSGSPTAASSKVYVDGYGYDVAYGASTKSTASQPSYPSSVGYNGQVYDSYYSTPAAGYGKPSTSTVGYNGYAGYENADYASSTPYPTQAWYSQPGYVPITKTYTTTTVETITQCNRDKYCPLNTATPTLIVTGVKTITTIVAIPTTTVYVTSVVDVCSTGLTTSTVTVTQTCNAGCVTRPTGPTQGFTTTVKYCAACATPSTVTVTLCTSCTGTPAKPTPPPALSQPANPPFKASSVPVYDSSNKYTPPAIPSISKPAGGVPSAPPKPSVPVGYNSTVIVPSTPSKTLSIQTTPAVASGYGCSGSNCPTKPTSYTPAQFTGAAEKAKLPFVVPVIFAGFALFM